MAVMEPDGKVSIYYSIANAPEEMGLKGLKMCFFNGHEASSRSVSGFIQTKIRYTWLFLARKASEELSIRP